MKIGYILQVSSHARYWRRIRKLEMCGVESTVLAFERSFYSGNVNNRFVSLGSVQRERYLKRLLPLFRAVGTSRKELRDVDVVYSFGLDTFFIAWLATSFKRKKPLMVYEVGDIRTVFMKGGWVSSLFCWLERRILKRKDLLVVTSEAFVEGYFKDIQNQKDVEYHVIENKVELTEDSLNKKYDFGLEEARIRIGYFGMLRCERTLEILIDLMDKFPERFEVYIRGKAVGTEKLLEKLSMMAHVSVEGEYQVPEDLAEMYKNIDIIWAAYPFQGKNAGNWKWARTTRFYEACYFGKPMIVQADTQDALQVVENGLGIALNLSDITESVKRIGELTNNQIASFVKEYSELDPGIYLYTDEHQQLTKKLMEKMIRKQ